jgi:hypothetical protein
MLVFPKFFIFLREQLCAPLILLVGTLAEALVGIKASRF